MFRTALSGLTPTLGMTSDFYYSHAWDSSSGGAATAALTANRLYGIPVVVGYPTVFDGIAINVSGAAAAGKLIRLGVYGLALNQATGIGGYPGALILDAGAVAADSTGNKIIAISLTLQPGWYILSAVTDGTPTVYTITTNRHGIIGTDDITLSNYFAFFRAFTYAALPDPFGTTSYSSGTQPRIALIPV